MKEVLNSIIKNLKKIIIQLVITIYQFNTSFILKKRIRIINDIGKTYQKRKTNINITYKKLQELRIIINEKI